ncbi:MAG TPA: FtsW/RodA/SpoVE family cell cycle protein [Herpetosiphonaceae bacterium]|nr:FtsW/RodA/SpoVE family cell cycle protein [Herpetosiphonaceae bacterium]
MFTSLRARGWREYNPMLLLAVLMLLAISVPLVYTTTVGANGTFTFGLGSSFAKHLIWVSAGIMLVGVLSVIDYQMLRPLALPLYVISLGVLGAVIALGRAKYGAQSWIGSSTLSFQPTEPAKLVLVIALAAFWSRTPDEERSWRDLVVSLLILAPPLGLVLLQPDFGSAMVMVGMWLIMAFIANTRWYHFLGLAVLSAPVAIYRWQTMAPYQKDRLTVFLNPERCDIDPEFYQRACWQTVQAIRAIGNGGLGGMGLLRGIQSQFNFLPVQESDFVFAVTAEELGFIGAAAVIVLQMIVIWQIWRVLEHARDPFGRLLVAGVGGLLLVHCLENIGMNMQMMPMTGIPLPFVSYGGSFTITVLAAIGLVQSVSLRHRRWSY